MHNRLWILIGLFCSTLSAANTSFTEKDYAQAIQSNPEVVFYFVSAGMPLSIKALPNIQAVTQERGIELIILNDPFEPVTLPDGSTPPSVEASERLSSLGIFLHFPSILLYKNGEQCGHWIPGYKSQSAYDQIIDMLESQCGITETPPPSSIKTSTTWSPVVISQLAMPSVSPSFAYFSRVVGNDWVSYSDSKSNVLFNRKTQDSFPVPGTYDGVPSPDSRFLTLSVPVQFFRFHEIIANPANAINVQPILTDTTMQDDYQSVGILLQHGRRAIYRVTTSVDTGGQTRDYSYHDGKLKPLAPSNLACADIPFATLYLSRDGRKLAGYNLNSGTSQIFYIGRSGKKCDVINDFNVATGKITFSPSGRWVTYRAMSGPNISVYALNLRTMESVLIDQAPMFESSNFSFPDFMPNGHISYQKAVFNRGTYDVTLFEVALRKNHVELIAGAVKFVASVIASEAKQSRQVTNAGS